MDYTDSIVYDTIDSEVGSVSTPKNLSASGSDKEQVQSAEELSSFDISDDNNPLKQQQEQMNISSDHELQSDSGIDSSTTSSRHTSLNADTPHNETNIMATPSSIFTYKTNTTRPSSRGTINQGYLSDRFEQRLDTAKAILLDTKLHEPESSIAFEAKATAKEGGESTREVTAKDNLPSDKTVESGRKDVFSEETSGSSPKRLHRIVSCDPSDTDTSSQFDSNLNVQPQQLGRILHSDEIYEDNRDRISTGAEITRLTKELTNYKVQIQLQEEIIRNNLLKHSDQHVSDDLLYKLKTLSMNETDSEEHKKYVTLEAKYKVLMEDIIELQNMNAQLIEDQEKEQITYDRCRAVNSEILSSLKDVLTTMNLDNTRSETKKNDLEFGLKQVLFEVRMILNEKHNLETTDDGFSFTRNNDNSVLRMSPVHRTKEDNNILESDTDTSLFAANEIIQENTEYIAQIKSLKQNIFEKDQKIEKQHTMLKTYKHSINEFVSLLQQLLNGYINEFIGFHSDFLSSAGRIFEQKSINEVFAILKRLVAVSDDYQNRGILINFQSVRSMMSPVWHHNSSIASMLIKRYESNVDKLKTENQKVIVNTKKENDLFKFKEEIKRYQDKIIELENQIKKKNDITEKSAAKKPSGDSTLKLRLDVMTKKWKKAQENLVFERRTNYLKIRELENEIQKLKR